MSAPSQPTRPRAEPTLGQIDDLHGITEQRPQNPTKQATRPPLSSNFSRWIFPITIVLILMLGAYAAIRYREPLRNVLIPNTELNDILARANLALSAGKLTGNQGDSARELFEKARALDEDNDPARQGLNQVGERLLQQAYDALAKKDFAAAKTFLSAAQEILAGGAQIERMESALKQAETQTAVIEESLQKAETAFAAGKLLGEKSANAYYQRMLQVDPGNTVALAGQKKIADTLAKQAQTALVEDNQEMAEQHITDLSRVAPNHASIPELRAAISKKRTDAAAKAKAELETWLTQAEEQLHAGVFTGANNSAQTLFQTVLKREPGNAKAKSGLRKVAQALMVQANAALEENDVDLARELLSQAEKLGANSSELQAAKSQLREVQEQLDITQEQETLTAEQRLQVRNLLSKAEKAIRAGNLATPPGESAYDYYRAVLRMDPKNAKALAGLRRIEQ